MANFIVWYAQELFMALMGAVLVLGGYMLGRKLKGRHTVYRYRRG